MLRSAIDLTSREKVVVYRILRHCPQRALRGLSLTFFLGRQEFSDTCKHGTRHAYFELRVKDFGLGIMV